MSTSTKDCGNKHIKVFGTIVVIVLAIVGWGVRWTGATVAESNKAINVTLSANAEAMKEALKEKEIRIRTNEQNVVMIVTRLDMILRDNNKILEYVKKGNGNDNE